jgi:hypothetical protein
MFLPCRLYPVARGSLRAFAPRGASLAMTEFGSDRELVRLGIADYGFTIACPRKPAMA